jgi:hypothetical protein
MKRWLVRFNIETGEVAKIVMGMEAWADTRPRLYESNAEGFATLFLNAIDELGAYSGFVKWKGERDRFDKLMKEQQR